MEIIGHYWQKLAELDTICWAFQWLRPIKALKNMSDNFVMPKNRWKTEGIKP